MEEAWDNSGLAVGKSIKEVILALQRETKGKSTFATLMDICHLKNAELEPKFHRYKGRVVLRGDTEKDDSGSCAVFTPQSLKSFL